MQSVAKFVTKAYPVSGCCDYLSEVRTESELVWVHVCARVSSLAVPPSAGSGVRVRMHEHPEGTVEPAGMSSAG